MKKERGKKGKQKGRGTKMKGTEIENETKTKR
jgi:hypothetical protein